MQAQNGGHKMNGAMCEDSFFDSKGFVHEEQSVKVSNSKAKMFPTRILFEISLCAFIFLLC